MRQQQMRTASPTTDNLVMKQTLVIRFFDYRKWIFLYIFHFCLVHKPPVVTLNSYAFSPHVVFNCSVYVSGKNTGNLHKRH